LTDLHIRATDTRRMASLVFNQTLYQDHPYGPSVQGYFETVPHLTRPIWLLSCCYYGPAGMIITLVGAVKAEVALEKITAVLGDWQNEQQRPLPPCLLALVPTNSPSTYTPLPEKSQADIHWDCPVRRAARPITGRQPDEYYPGRLWHDGAHWPIGS
jgi:zinc protease